jgi:hypothetical protein
VVHRHNAATGQHTGVDDDAGAGGQYWVARRAGQVDPAVSRPVRVRRRVERPRHPRPPRQRPSPRGGAGPDCHPGHGVAGFRSGIEGEPAAHGDPGRGHLGRGAAGFGGGVGGGPGGRGRGAVRYRQGVGGVPRRGGVEGERRPPENGVRDWQGGRGGGRGRGDGEGQGQDGVEAAPPGRAGAEAGKHAPLEAEVGERARAAALVRKQARAGARAGEQGQLAAEAGEQAQVAADVGERVHVATVGDRGRRGEGECRICGRRRRLWTGVWRQMVGAPYTRCAARHGGSTSRVLLPHLGRWRPPSVSRQREHGRPRHRTPGRRPPGRRDNRGRDPKGTRKAGLRQARRRRHDGWPSSP